MHKASAWKTNDGRYFDTEKEAARHEAFEELGNIMIEYIDSGSNRKALIEAMLTRAGEMANIFSKYSQLHPKTQVQPDAVALEGERGTV